jgi:hypothetical protein
MVCQTEPEIAQLRSNPERIHRMTVMTFMEPVAFRIFVAGWIRALWRHERSGAAEARFSRYLIGPRRLDVEAIEIEKSDRGANGSSTIGAWPQNRIAAGGTLAL